MENISKPSKPTRINTQNILETKDKIISLLRIRGPSLPVHITSATGLSLILASALLSELIGENKVKVSHMKVGGSPVYFLPGQEPRLERYQDYIKGKEKEALSLLKQKQILQDESLLPAIRVALRSLRDFALTFPIDEKIYWRYFTLNEQEARLKLVESLKPIIKEIKPKEEIKPIEIKEKPIIKIEEKIEKPIEVKVREKPKIREKQSALEKPKLEAPILKLKKVREKKLQMPSNFVIKTLSLLKAREIELLEEIESKKKEFSGKVRINSDIGKIEFLAISKDKKSITENDLAVSLQKAQSLKLPLLFISQAKPNKKAQTYLDLWKNYIKLMEI